jgi:hypothetical protein
MTWRWMRGGAAFSRTSPIERFTAYIRGAKFHRSE